MLTDEEIKEIRNRATLNDNRQIDPMAFARDIERAVMKKLGEQEPIYMWRIGNEGWIECTKAWFDSPMVEGYEKRIVYAHPLPAPAVPEGWQLVPIEPAKEMCDAYCKGSIAPVGNLSRYGYKAMLSAAPKP